MASKTKVYQTIVPQKQYDEKMKDVMSLNPNKRKKTLKHI